MREPNTLPFISDFSKIFFKDTLIGHNYEKQQSLLLLHLFFYCVTWVTKFSKII